MANIIRTYHLTGAQLQGMSNGIHYYLGPPIGVGQNATLNQLASFAAVPPNAVLIDASQYQTVRTAVSCSTLTGSAGGTVLVDNLYPEFSILNPVGTAWIIDSLAIAALTPANSILFSATAGPYASNLAVNYQSRWGVVAVRLTFTTVPTVATDMYVTLFGFGWKSERND